MATTAATTTTNKRYTQHRCYFIHSHSSFIRDLQRTLATRKIQLASVDADNIHKMAVLVSNSGS